MAIRQTTAGNITKKTIRIPLVGNLQQRSTTLTNKDQQFLNCMVETSTNVVTSTKKLFLVKRPGTELYNAVTSTAEGRGVWYFAGHIYSVFGNTLYKNSTSVQTLSTSTGNCGAVEFINTTDYGNPALFLADGIDAWIIKYDGTVTRVDNKYLQWTSNAEIELGDRRTRTSLAHWFTCTVAGKTGSSEPTWNTTVGATTTDGTVTWRCEGTFSTYAKWNNGVSKSVGNLVIPTSESGYWYECVTAGTTGASQPTWPLVIGDTVTDNTVTWKCMGQYGGFPTPHIPTPTFMDGYIFLPKSNSNDIWNSDVVTPNSWGALNFVGVESFSDTIVGLARQNNYIVAFGKSSTEFLYNSAKANGITDFDSPIDRAESYVLQTGSLNRNSILQSEKVVMFIGSSKLGGHGVWRIDGTTAKEISTEYVEKFIDLETDVTDISGYGFRIAGHFLFMINLPTSDKTFVYDLEENMWVEWNLNGGAFPFNNFCDANGVILLQHKTNGSIYKLNPEIFIDFNSDIDYYIRLAKQDFDTDNYKFFHQIVLIGDETTDSVEVRWSDDDYNTWSNIKYLHIGDRPYYMRTGVSRRRAWEIRHTGNSRVRLEALEIVYSIGEH